MEIPVMYVIIIVAFIGGCVMGVIFSNIGLWDHSKGTVIISENEENQNIELRFIIEKPYELLDQKKIVIKIEKDQNVTRC